MDKESRKQQIIQCACAMFAQDGYDATSLAQIAKGCGCSPSLIIRHFGSTENQDHYFFQRTQGGCQELSGQRSHSSVFWGEEQEW